VRQRARVQNGGVSPMADVRVLIVDDQPPFRIASRMVVEMTDGFEVAGEAGNGEEAVELAATLRPDLVLMDVQMPGMDGLEATRRIRALADPPPVVVMSTHESGDYQQTAVEAGAFAFLAKSEFSMDALEGCGGTSPAATAEPQCHHCRGPWCRWPPSTMTAEEVCRVGACAPEWSS